MTLHHSISLVSWPSVPSMLSLEDGNSESENAIAAEVREINFAGATSSIKLDANGLLLEALTLEADGLSAGDHCRVVLPPERISLLKNE